MEKDYASYVRYSLEEHDVLRCFKTDENAIKFLSREALEYVESVNGGDFEVVDTRINHVIPGMDGNLAEIRFTFTIKQQ